MLRVLARGLYFGFLAVMLVVWAMSLGKPQSMPPVDNTEVFYLIA